ncbi:MAG: ABC transporter permease [Candidatus Dormiibacterota bacterium]
MSAAVAGAAFTPRTRPSLAGAVRSELLKIRRQALTWALVALFAVASAIALVSLVIGPATRSELEHRPLAFYFAYLSGCQALFDIGSGILLLVLTARLVGMEYSGGTVRIVLARGTGRLQLLAAQLIGLAITAVLLLAAFVVVATAFLGATVVTWHGNLSPITSLPAVAGRDTLISLLVGLVSMGVSLLLGTAAAAVGRSLPFAVGAALGFFPADNFGTIVMHLLGRVTQNHGFWYSLTQWFLGPSLNQLAAALQTDHAGTTFLPTPLVTVTAAHLWAVIGVWSAVFLVASVALTWRRDVQE